jgi:competence protein ComFC
MLRALSKTILELIWPRRCHVCYTIFNKTTLAFDQYLCSLCAEKLIERPLSLCSICGQKRQGSLAFCKRCLRNKPSFDQIHSCYQYEGVAKELIHQLKFKQRVHLASTLGQLMIKQAHFVDKSFFGDCDLLLPIPLHPTRKREREFNQAQLLAQYIGKQIKKPLRTDILYRTKNTLPQADLNRTKRWNNIKNAFTLTSLNTLKDKSVLLIDDVVTTTATIQEASTVLKKGGARNIRVLSFAKGMYS